MTNPTIGLDAVAQASVKAVRELIKQPLNAATTIEFGPRRLGDIVEVCKPGTEDEMIAVTLAYHKDVSFVVTSEDLTLPFNEFLDKFLMPAIDALAEAIGRSMAAAGPGAQFVSAPLPVLDEWPGAVATLDGISLRVILWYDMNRHETVMSIDVLYGVAVAESAVAA